MDGMLVVFVKSLVYNYLFVFVCVRMLVNAFNCKPELNFGLSSFSSSNWKENSTSVLYQLKKEGKYMSDMGEQFLELLKEGNAC